MNNKNFNNYFEKVENNFISIYNAFYLWTSLNNPKYNPIYNRYKHFWGITISSVQFYWLLGIPKLFEESKKSKKRKEEVISIPFLLEFIPEGENKKKIKKEIDEQKSILKIFKEWRNKILAHQDKIVADNIIDFYKKNPIIGNQTEKLLGSIIKILGMFKSIITDDSVDSVIIGFSPSIKEKSKQDLDNIMGKLSKD